MSFDNSRITFNPFTDYSGVVMEQGRVQTDADWNEWLSQQQRRVQASTLDALGAAVYPASTPFAFQINPTASKTSVTIGRGRMYVDGILVENHGDPTKAFWDPALAEMSGSPQPPPPTDANPVDFTSQPYYPGAKLPTAAGDYLFYLDVWQQPVTSIEDPNLIDAAIGVDTTGRLKTMWRVDFQPSVEGLTCATAVLSNPVSSGQLSNGTVTSGTSGPCCLSTGSGYTGVENQFYRVEIHNPGKAGGGGAFFKWSRENASVQTTVSSVASGSNTAGNPASVLTVASLGRDQVLGFSPGNWIEITSETNDKLCQPGRLYQIDSVDPAGITITLTTTLSTLPNASDAYTRIIRWDQSGKVYQGDGSTLVVDLDAVSGGVANGVTGIPVPSDGSSVILENGIIVTFTKMPATGVYLPMDYWNFSARTSTGLLDPLSNAPPRGQHHHRAALSIVTIDASSKVTNATNCRTEITRGGSGCCECCTATVGTGGSYATIKDALAALPAQGGEICLMPGTLYEDVVLSGLQNIVIHGCEGQTQVYSASLDPNAASSSGTTNPPPTPISQSGFPAVFTIVDCVHIEVRDFTICADTGAVGILLDRTPDSRKSAPPDAGGLSYEMVVIGSGRGNRDILLEDLIVEASTLPAIVAVSVTQLKVLDNRIFMKDVRSLWGAIYLAGDTIYFRHNWVGIGAASQFLQAPIVRFTKGSTTMTSVDQTQSGPTPSPATATGTPRDAITYTVVKAGQAPGGVHIGGPSKDVFVMENEIVGGLYNGITLGNFILLDTHGYNTGSLSGVRWEYEANYSSGGIIQIPGSRGTGTKIERIVAGDLIENLHIDRNYIHQTGMAGIGMVGFWNMREVAEAISIVNLTITANTISNTALRQMALIDNALAGFAYAAITLADVNNLILRDNTITDFGETPAANVCAIFLLHGQLVEISRNQIRETRDWKSDAVMTVEKASTTRAGISIYLVTPPTIDSSSDVIMRAARHLEINAFTGRSSYIPRRIPLYEDGLPALRINENVVRVAFCLALHVFGYGPFFFAGNHFSSGGYVYVDGQRDHPVALDTASFNTNPLLVKILNLGVGIEFADRLSHFSDVLAAGDTGSFSGADSLVAAGAGAILFTDNVCQLEAKNSNVSGLCSVAIMTLDDLIFNSNHLWIDAPEGAALADSFVVAATTQMSNNRFQEQRRAVLLSAASLGAYANITAHNLATMPLKIGGPSARKVDAPNVILF